MERKGHQMDKMRRMRRRKRVRKRKVEKMYSGKRARTIRRAG